MVAENATAVATLTATDEDTASEDLSWSIPEGGAGGADAAKFALTADGALSFKAAKDFEAPDDADTDGDYEVTVRVTDGSNPVDAALVVRLSDVDDAPPTLSSASVDGDELTLTFSEALDGHSVPPTSSFAATVTGSARTVDAVAVAGKVVTLTLSSAVASGATVTVGYTVPTGAGAKPLQDAADNAVATFANAQVTNETVALPVVSIAASTTPVTEATAAAFTLARTGSTDAELTVQLSVTETGEAMSGTPSTSVTFAAGSASATLSVATEDDEVSEDASTVTATVSSGAGYTVDGTSGSAEVVVEDDDAAPVVTTASPIVVAENATAVVTLAATDADTASEDLSWSIPEGGAGGADAAKFALTADGALSFKAAKDFETPDDADNDRDYEVSVRVTDGSNPVDAALVVRLSDVDEVVPTASFEELPERHDGAAAFDFELHFSQAPAGLSYKTVRGGLLEVTGATVTGARRLVKGSNQGWQVTIVPNQAGDIVITLPARACSETNAICIDGEPLAQAATATVPGPAAPSLPVVSVAASTTLTADGALSFKAAKDFETPDDADNDRDYEVSVRVTDGSNPVDAALVVRLSDVDEVVPTASFEELPERHDGAAAFDFELHFSQAPAGLSYKTVRGGLLEVTGATVTGARRLVKGSNQGWQVTIVPNQAGDIVITLPARACSETNAICIDGEPLAQAATATVPGPAAPSLPVVSVAASTTPVTEGTAAAFTLARTGSTDAALTVEVSVAETGAAVSGTPPTSMTFAAGSASATLIVATEDDEVSEDASTVTATVSSGTGYTVDGTSGSAEVVVEDDDAAPVVTTASPIVVAENATAVATLAATDADTNAGDVSWSIPKGADGGADRAKFVLTAGGVLTFREAKDFETPDDADTDGDYEVMVRVTDGANPVDAALVVRLADIDEVAPTLSGAAVDVDELTVTFGEALDESSRPSASSFAVTVAGSLRGVSAAAVSGKVVTLTLSSAVTAGEAVTVGYTVPTGAGAKPLKDTAGNAAAAFSSTQVTNETAALPVVSIAASTTPMTEGTAVAFTLLRTGATDAELTVEVSVSESGASVSGTPPTSVTFAAESSTATLSVATEDDEVAEAASTLTATVSSGTGYTVDGTSGSGDVVVNDDDAAPVVTTASPIEVAENGTRVATLAAMDEDTVSEDLSWLIPEGADGGADASKFALTAAGVLTFKAAKDYETPDDADTDGDYVVTVRVTDGANPVDAALVVRLSDVDEVAPTLSGASVDGAGLTLTFSEALDGDSVPPASSFAVTVAGSGRTVDTAAVSGKVVTLTLSSAATSADTVTVGYTVPTGAGATPVKDAVGNLAAAFARTPVTNATVALPVVSVAASTTPVSEGTAAAFTLTRTGATDAALTVDVSVSESEAAVSGTAPTSVTFAAESSTATLSVATEDDEVAEDASTLTATVSSGTGYTVDGTSGSAEVVVVDDDDATPVVTTASPIEVAENATAVATLVATDEDTASEDLSWLIPEGDAGGADASKFALTAAGVLTFRAAKDYESPDDTNTDGDYEVTVRVSDGANPVDVPLVVRLADADDAAPVLSSASVDGAALTLTFGETLDGNSTPPASAFTATVAGKARTVDAVSISESTASLTLSSAVTSGQTVKVDYTAPTGEEAKPLRDAVGNRAVSFVDAEVTNATSTVTPVVSIAASTTPVTEGTAAAFTLTRTGATDAALTVEVSVSQAGSVMSGAAPTKVVFAANAPQARLTVATVDDDVDEPDARITASIAATNDFNVDAAARSAGVDVFDDDAPLPASVAVWTSTLTWTGAGNGWLIANAEDFSDPDWSENGRDYQVQYVAYASLERELWVSLDGAGGAMAEPGQLALQVGGATLNSGDVMTAFAPSFTIARGIEQGWEAGEEVTVRLTRTAEAQAAPSGPGLSVADAQVNESAGSALRFRVTLDAAADTVVSVRYRTSNGTAQAGADYVAAHGAVRFGPGETAKTVEVRVLEDTHDEASETMTLTLSAPYGATLADATATGTISNTDPIPKAWIARFGRTVAAQAIDAVEARFDAPREAGLAGTLAGQPLSGMSDAVPGDSRATDTREGLEALAGWLDGTAGEDADGTGTRTLGGREVLAGSAFALTGGTAGSGFASLWGRGAVTRFDGRDGDLSVDGEVASAMLGADWSRDRVLAGLMLSHSRGEGGYQGGSGSGTVESTLTALFPYGRYALTERVSVWGMAGYGEGTLTLTPEGQAPLRPGLDLLMGALGFRGVLLDGGADGTTLEAKSDAMAVRTSTDAVSESAGRLEASQADVTRVRFALEGSRAFGLGADAVLTPSLELGVRHDGGDAETGFGADIGAGLILSAPSRGLSAELRARGLLTHEDGGFGEQGVSGTLSFDPSPDSDRGLSLSLTQSVGAQSAGGADALLERTTLAGIGAEEDSGLSRRRLDVRIGYGLGVFDERYTATPELGLGLSDRDRELRLGWRLTERVSTGLAFDMRIEAARREVTNDDTAPEHTVGLRLSARW